jgi:hypothetical protein
MIKTNPNKNIIIFIFKIKKTIESQGPQQFLKTECFLTDMALQISGSKSNATRNIIPWRKSDTLDKGHEPRNTNRTIKLKATGPGVHLETGRYGRQTQKAHKENIIKAKQANHAQEGDCQVGIGPHKKGIFVYWHALLQRLKIAMLSSIQRHQLDTRIATCCNETKQKIGNPHFAAQPPLLYLQHVEFLNVSMSDNNKLLKKRRISCILR